MEQIKQFLPYIIIVFMILFLVSKLRNNNSTKSAGQYTSVASVNTNTEKSGAQKYKTVEGLYMDWSQESKQAKLQTKFAILYVLLILFGGSALAIWLAVTDGQALEPLLDRLDGMGTQELVVFFNTDAVKYLVIFFSPFLIGSIILEILSFNGFVDLAKWLEINRIDCRALLRSGKGQKGCMLAVGNGYLIKEKPSSKSLFSLKSLVSIVLGVIFTIALAKFLSCISLQAFLVFVVMETGFTDWLKLGFTAQPAIHFYIVVVGMSILKKMLNKMVESQKQKLLNSNS